MNRKLVLIGLISAALIACGKSETSKATDPATRIPEKLAFQAPTPQGSPVDQKALSDELASVFSSSKASLPPSQLIFKKDKLTASEKKKLESELSAKDPVGMKLLGDLRSSNCQVQDLVETRTPPLPPGESSVGFKNKQGDRVLTTSKAGIVGSACPVQFDFGLSNTSYYEEFDEQTGKFSLTGATDASIKARVIPREYQTWLKTRGLAADFKLNALLVMRENDKKQQVTKTLATGSFSASYLTLSSELKATSSGQILSKVIAAGTRNERQESESIITSEIVTPSGKQVTVVQHQLVANDKVVQNDVYINGHKQTAEQQKNIFGQNSPGLGHLNNLELNTALGL